MSDTSDWWPSSADHPAFRVQRSSYLNAPGGDFVRGELGTKTAIRSAARRAGWDVIRNDNVLFARAISYDTAELTWGWPTEVQNTWQAVALVRSGFGRPVTPKEGLTIFRSTRADMKEAYMQPGSEDVEELFNAPTIFDSELTSGHWYYYSLFFQTTPLDWIKGASAQVLLPENHHHAEHLYDRIPPFYQQVDSNNPFFSTNPRDRQTTSVRLLEQFLKIFGFELDLTRQYVESQQQTYQTDLTPVRLLAQLAPMFDVTHKDELGDTRLRAVTSEITDLQKKRGTPLALKRYLELVTGYECDVTSGINDIRISDSSDFFAGIGSWANYNRSENGGSSLNPNWEATATTDVLLYVNTTEGGPSRLGAISRVLQFRARSAELGITLALGYGKQPKPPPSVMDAPPNPNAVNWVFAAPLDHATVVEPGEIWGFSIYARTPVVTPDVRIQIGVTFVNEAGALFATEDWHTAVLPADHDWYRYTFNVAAPPLAQYIVPLVRIYGAAKAWTLFLAGAMVYKVADAP